MQLLRFIPIQLTIFLIVGILVGNWVHFPMYMPWIFTFICFGFLAFTFIRKKQPDSLAFGIMVGLTAFCIGILAISVSNRTTTDHYSKRDFKNLREWRLKVTAVLKPNRFSTPYIVQVQSIDQKPASGKMLLSLSNDSLKTDLAVDNELLLFSTATEIRAPLNPHQFNYKSYMAQMGIEHQLRVPRGAYLMEQGSSTLKGRAARLRNRIKKKLQEAGFKPRELSIIQALLLGERNDLSAATYNDYKNAGAVHILAVSGLHIGILLLLLQFLLRPLERLPKGKTFKLLVTVLLLWAFAFLAGMSASIVRAVSMFSFVAYALYLNRPSNTFNILALSMFFILLAFDARLLFHIGFQMSYAAVFAIIWMYPLLQKCWFPKNFILGKVWQLLSVSIAAQLGVLPISLFYFHQFPGLFFVSNLLIVPFLGIILGMGIVVIVLVLFDFLPVFLAKIYGFLIGTMNAIVSWIAKQEAFVFQNISFDEIQVLLSYLIIIALLATIAKVSFKRIASLLMLLLLFQAWVFYQHYTTTQTGTFLIAHRTGNTVFLEQAGTTLHHLTGDSTQLGTLTKDYGISERITKNSYKPVPNSFTWNGKQIVLIDSTGVYSNTLEKVDYLILTQSPKIHLERAITRLKPKMVIADGSNYNSAIPRWRATCEKEKLPFHYTGEKGAYYFEKGSN